MCYALLLVVAVFTAEALQIKKAVASQTDPGAIGDEPKVYFNVHTRCNQCAEENAGKYDYGVCQSDPGHNPYHSQDDLKSRMMVMASMPETAWKMYTTRPVVEKFDAFKQHCGSCKLPLENRNLRAKVAAEGLAGAKAGAYKKMKESDPFSDAGKALDLWWKDQLGEEEKKDVKAPVKNELFKPPPKEAQNKVKQIFYINLDGSDYRKNSMEAQLKANASGIPYERFRATTRGQAEKADLKKYSKNGVAQYVLDQYSEKNEQWGTVAVFMSQFNLLQHIAETDPDGEGVYIILEDDAKLSAGWKDKVEKLLATQVPEDWDILKLGRPWYSYMRCEDRINEHVYEARTPDQGPGIKFYSGNVGYAIRPKSVPSILQQLYDGYIMDVDGAMMSMFKSGEDKSVDKKTYYWNWGARTYASSHHIVADPGGGDSDRLQKR